MIGSIFALLLALLAHLHPAAPAAAPHVAAHPGAHAPRHPGPLAPTPGPVAPVPGPPSAPTTVAEPPADDVGRQRPEEVIGSYRCPDPDEVVAELAPDGSYVCRLP